MKEIIKNLENYLNDLDNLIDTGWFPNDSVKECTFYHQDLTLRDFIQKGREYIRQQLMMTKIDNDYNKEWLSSSSNRMYHNISKNIINETDAEDFYYEYTDGDICFYSDAGNSMIYPLDVKEYLNNVWEKIKDNLDELNDRDEFEKWEYEHKQNYIRHWNLK